MKLAMRKLKNLGWLALVLIVAICLYPLSLSVASVHSDLVRTEAKIVNTKQRLRYMETEFATRASMRQLELWNALDYGYEAPEAAQYITGERALANLGKGRKHMRDIVEVAIVNVDNAAGTIGSPFGDGIAIAKPGDAAPDDAAADDVSSDDIASSSDRKPVDLPSNAPTMDDLLENNRLSSSDDPDIPTPASGGPQP